MRVAATVFTVLALIFFSATIRAADVIFEDDFTGTVIDWSKWEIFDTYHCSGNPTVTQDDELIITFPSDNDNCGSMGVVSKMDFGGYTDNISYEVDFHTTSLRNWQDHPLSFDTPIGVIVYKNHAGWTFGWRRSDGTYTRVIFATPAITEEMYNLKIEIDNGVLKFWRAVGGGGYTQVHSVNQSEFMIYEEGSIKLRQSDRGPSYYDNLVVTSWGGCLLAYLDIKPGSCPNPLNVNAPKIDVWVQTDENTVALKMRPDRPQVAKPVLPVAILGTADFDVTDIDPATVTLESVPALRWNIEDVSTPVGEDAEECECNTFGADGYPDLTLKFDKSLIVEALGEVYDGDVVALTITGELSNSTAFEGTDCVVIHGDSQPADGFSPPEEPPTAVLLGNFPNPFNPTTEISFSLPNATDVKLDVYNIMGQQVATIVDRFMEAGTHRVIFDGRDGSGRSIASGIYFYRLEAGEFVETKKMVLLK